MKRILLLCLLGLDVAISEAADPISFGRDILPILSDNCFHCHGPDAKTREADLRLDEASSALRIDNPIVVPHRSGESELIRRIRSADPDELMPPPNSKRKLTAQQIGLLQRWIDEGAVWGKHWAFEKLACTEVQATSTEYSKLCTQQNVSPPRNPIDAFIRARLERENALPSPEASKETLIRRVSLDLTGLPPTLEEIDAFLADQSPEAYEKVVDRLLHSPRFGERMVWDWLDAARYADTNGYQGDPTRPMWYWRDWAIEALNRNMPYDQFTIEQLAGDLLPNPSQSQLIATGFHRNHMINGEGGRIAEESRVDYVQDRVETTGTVWMGLTLNCCRCHDHKFDPVSQREYYQLAAYFNSIDESGANDAGGLANPVMSLATPDQQQRLEELRAAESQSAQARDEAERKLRTGQREWEESVLKSLSPESGPAWSHLNFETLTAESGSTLKLFDDGSVLVGGENPPRDSFTLSLKKRGPVTGIRLEALPHESLVNSGPGRADNGNFVLTELKLTVGDKPIELSALQADYEQPGFPPGNAVDSRNDTGWAIASEFGKPHVAVFEPRSAIGDATDERPIRIRLEFQSMHVAHVLGRFRISITASPPAALRSLPAAVREALALAPEQRKEAQAKAVTEFYLNSDPSLAAARNAVEGAKKARENFERSLPRTMVMRERAQPRDTFILVRGAYDKYGEKVAHGTPSVLPTLPSDAATNRLALARWLVSLEHPLTARVTVNRYWQMLFGTGLVKTSEDFGVQGEKPSHPELLDWLACEFQRPTVSQPSVANSHPDNAWNVKHILRLIVTSGTYRQGSRQTAIDEQRQSGSSSVPLISPSQMSAQDPENRLLSRGPRYRLPSWMIRDQALMVSALLVEKQGGPPVKGYQPPGIWEEATFGKIQYQPDRGESLYRRSLYQFWRRIVGPTVFFDVATRQTCQVKVARTNTPLHALATLNDVTYVEAARALAQRVLLGPGKNDEERLADAFRRCTARHPRAPERAVLKKRLQLLRTEFSTNSTAAKELISIGDSKPDERHDPAELAAYTSIAALLFNLDETLSKE